MTGHPSAGLNLGPLSELGLDLKHFLQESATTPEEDRGSDLLQGPPAEDNKDCIEWRGCRVHTPDWWQELVRIPGIKDFQELTQKIRASFELPQVKSKAQDVKNDYLAPPAPKCIHQKEFLPPQNPMLPSQDFREGQSQKTLAYAQALQYWAEKANPPMPGQPYLLARCVLELRRVMKLYMAFSNDTILEGAAPQKRLLKGQAWAPIPMETQAGPTDEPTKEPAPTTEPTGELAPTAEATREPAPTDEPTDEPAPAEVTVKEMAPTDEPTEEPAPTGFYQS